MGLRTSNVLAMALLSTTGLVSSIASAQLASCADILTNPPLVGNPAIISPTSVQATTGGVAYCNVTFTYRDPALVGQGSLVGSGPEYFPGYAPGAPPMVDTYENIRMGF